jgi:hypothetical protein
MHMIGFLDIVITEFAALGPEFALLLGVPDLRPLQRRLRTTVRAGNAQKLLIL